MGRISKRGKLMIVVLLFALAFTSACTSASQVTTTSTTTTTTPLQEAEDLDKALEELEQLEGS